MTLQVEARAFLDKLKGAEWGAFFDAFKALPDALSKVVAKMKYDDDRVELDKYFVPENAKCSTEHPSPSGAYKLKVTSFSTREGAWNYTQGLVFKQGSDEPIAEVRRNYSAFPFSWIENHKNGHAYLVCGEDYQGQTVLELDTGRRRDHVPRDEAVGHGFCWAGHEFHAETSTLVVDGCFWACPYEFRFFDFTDPMSGWPEIEIQDEYVEADRRSPTFEPDGTIKCYQTAYEEPDDDESGGDRTELLLSIKTFRREGLKLLLVEEWVSDKEKQIRADREEANRKYEEWLTNYRASDPLYLAMKSGAKALDFKSADYESIGYTYEKWCPDLKVDERRMCWRLHSDGKKTVDIDIAVATGPVKLTLYKDGKTHEEKFFMEHSVASVEAALAYAKEFVS